MLAFNIERAVFEDDNEGYCSICIVNSSLEGNWIEIHGNQEKAEYPLSFNNKAEVDQFADKLKSFLKD